MVLTALIDDYLVTYLTNVADQNINAVGLILGQSCSGKDYIIHFAKTPPFQSEEDKKLGKPVQNMKSLDDMNPNWIADHAKQTTRMLPGGMSVLGVFLVSPDDLLTPFHSKLKLILQTIHKQLDMNKYLHGNPSSEKLVLHFSSKSRKYFCKTYDVISHNIQPVEVKSVAKKWNNVECNFGIDKVKFIRTNEADWPLEKHIKVMLDEIHDNLESSVLFFEGEFKDEDDSLENVGKKKTRTTRSTKVGHDVTESSKPIRVSILTKCSNMSGSSDSDSVIETSGQLRIVGQVSCKLWLQPKMSIKEAAKALKQDIMRSLESRLEMHWDSLTEEENSEDVNCVHEPPRRVLIRLPNSNITLSDYLFPGEGAQDAKVSLEELLDIKIKGKLQILDVEGQPDITEYCKGALESESKEILPKLNSDANQFMYLGMVAAVIVLIVSLLLHLYT
nr:protein odr-4 homolog [Leptinotarsa decemlineata]